MILKSNRFFKLFWFFTDWTTQTFKSATSLSDLECHFDGERDQHGLGSKPTCVFVLCAPLDGHSK